MEFGVFAQLFVPKFERAVDPHAEHKRIMRNVEIAKAADQHAFKYVWCPQHHFLDEYSHMPGPEAFLGHCSAITERVHLGSAIFNITPPVNKPVRIAENVALLDHLSNNRFEFGTGRGSSTTEVNGFDIADINETKAMWREAIGEIPKMWKKATYSYEGQYFRVPEREVFPKPHGPSHPAMWVAAGSPGTFSEAGELGLGAFCFSTGSPDRLRVLVENYKKEISNATPVGDYVNDNIMGVTNMLCMEDRKKAFEVASNMGMNYYTSLMYHWLDNIPKPDGLPDWPEALPEPTPEMVEAMTNAGLVIVGDPDDCVTGVQRWIDNGFDQLTFSPTTNTLPTEVVVQSMELFGREVIPQFDKDPVHSTTRYREAAVALPPDLQALAAEVSNWGRWGDDDELGTLNLIDAAAVARGVAAARTGVRIPLAIRLDANGPQLGNVPGRTNPLHTMVAINQTYTGDASDACFNDDTIAMGLQAATHWDALAHVAYDGLLYNGFPVATVTADRCATRCGIHKVTSIVTRGILLDVARAKGVDLLDLGYPITEADLEAAVELAGVRPEPGDVVLVRTGKMRLFKARDRQAYTLGDTPGLTVGTIPWLRRHDVAAVATDTFTLEVFPGEDPAVLFPVHMIQLRDMGLTQGQNFDLEALGEHCAGDGVYEMLLVANPEPVTGGTGAPTAPVAIK